MIIDIGEGTTEIAIISLGGIVFSKNLLELVEMNLIIQSSHI